MKINSFKGFIFDLDGTLLDSINVWKDIDVEFLSKRGYEVPADYCEAISALGLKDGASYTIDRFSLADTPEMLIDEWTTMAKKAYSEDVKAFSFTQALLSELKRQGKKLAVATTNHKDLYLQALHRNKLDGFFDTIVDADMVAVGKHEPEIYLLAAKNMGLEPNDCVVFEDIAVGLSTAAKAGFSTIAVAMYNETYETEAKTADRTVTDFSELLNELRDCENKVFSAF